MDLQIPQLVVKDTRLALGHIAEQHRLNQTELQLIGVTGSNGKTTVKTLLAHCLSQIAPTWSTPGNLNNDYGVPRTLLQIKPEHRYAVIEMGANHRGEIGYLTRLVHPDIAVITLAADAHLEGFGSLQAIIDTKGEIFHGLNLQGIGVINTDSPGFEQWQQSLANKGFKTFGQSKGAEVQVQNIQQTEHRLVFTLAFDFQGSAMQLAVEMAILGQHNAMNAAAVTAVCLALGLTPQQIKTGLESFQGVGGRLQIHRWPKLILIDDSYNANPSSVKAAIDTLSALPGKKILCLGQMAELGAMAESAHTEVGEYARQKGVDELFSYGELTQFTQTAFNPNKEAQSTPHTHDEIAQAVWGLLDDHADVVNVLVKGSRSARMEQVVQRILERMAHADSA
jgi:UDP-N-acetylmuramoyl-tripeptide--D-alanyl-D-alanine ligase